MCTVSRIMDDWNKKHQDPESLLEKLNTTRLQNLESGNAELKKEVADLRNDIYHMKQLLKAAKLYDEQTDQPNCETAEKIKAFKTLADSLGININDVFPD